MGPLLLAFIVPIFSLCDLGFEDPAMSSQENICERIHTTIDYWKKSEQDGPPISVTYDMKNSLWLFDSCKATFKDSTHMKLNIFRFMMQMNFPFDNVRAKCLGPCEWWFTIGEVSAEVKFIVRFHSIP
ncbi:MAG: hypothetical protein Satyrvirus21_5 [Satyrvirus sp.]|uniref:Uncharacterized protein n=1 Tax=Satyrvirus sp. TaxID=2487771 RepID=A0A3G5AGU6_9VIRU|nr:MAG: hypothetical protein Satyrvirus21_5 [Satyrvirus sp.]